MRLDAAHGRWLEIAHHQNLAVQQLVCRYLVPEAANNSAGPGSLAEIDLLNVERVSIGMVIDSVEIKINMRKDQGDKWLTNETILPTRMSMREISTAADAAWGFPALAGALADAFAAAGACAAGACCIYVRCHCWQSSTPSVANLRFCVRVRLFGQLLQALVVESFANRRQKLQHSQCVLIVAHACTHTLLMASVTPSLKSSG